MDRYNPNFQCYFQLGAFDRVNTIFSVILFSRKFNCIESITLNLNAQFDFQNPLPSKRGRKLNWFYCLKIKLEYIFTWALLRTILLAGPHQRLIHNYQTCFTATLKKKTCLQDWRVVKYPKITKWEYLKTVSVKYFFSFPDPQIIIMFSKKRVFVPRKASVP